MLRFILAQLGRVASIVGNLLQIYYNARALWRRVHKEYHYVYHYC